MFTLHDSIFTSSVLELPRVRHAFSTRLGGVSTDSATRSMNVAPGHGDTPGADLRKYFDPRRTCRRARRGYRMHTSDTLVSRMLRRRRYARARGRLGESRGMRRILHRRARRRAHGPYRRLCADPARRTARRRHPRRVRAPCGMARKLRRDRVVRLCRARMPRRGGGRHLRRGRTVRPRRTV